MLKTTVLFPITYLLFLFPLSLSSQEPGQEKESGKASHSCSINLHQKVFFTLDSLQDPSKSPDFSLDQIIEKGDCPLPVQKGLVRQLASMNGRINTDYLRDILQTDFPQYTVTLSPPVTEIRPLAEFLKQEMNLPPTYSFSETRSQGQFRPSPLISWGPEEEVRLECSNCQQTGLKNIRLIVFPKRADNRGTTPSQSFWVSARLKERARVLKARTLLQAFSPSPMDDAFEEDFLEVEDPKIYFQDLQTLKYFKLNKSLAVNEPLKLTDLSPLTLVRAGSSIKVLLVSGNMKIYSTARATQSGTWGQRIPLVNLRSGKTFIGKITGPERALVDL